MKDNFPKHLLGKSIFLKGQIELKKSGKIDDKIFAETRLRRGVYGQRYDNGFRNDGNGSQKLDFPCGELTKGVDTVWDAPGMQRIKIPYGKMTADQVDCMADLAEEYSDSILHVTTRQDIQLHFVHIEDTPDMHRRLASVGITTREACGNSVRNITACEFAGTCQSETFDVTPYAEATTQFLLGHPDVQDFGRKFKIAFSGCHDEPCGLITFHDLGALARNSKWQTRISSRRGRRTRRSPNGSKNSHGVLPRRRISCAFAGSVSGLRAFGRTSKSRSSSNQISGTENGNR